MQSQTLVYAKIGLVGLVVLVLGALAFTAKLDPTKAATLITGVVGILVVSLGIVNAAQVTATAKLEAAKTASQPPTSPPH